jgi:superoxide dismutase, Cu-Zn family
MKPLFPALAAGLGLVAAPALAQQAVATLHNPEGTVLGQANITATPGGGVLIHVSMNGLEPGPHGFHVHETGACAPDFDAAGGHFAPEGRPHGFLTEGGPHAGDLPNLFASEDGRARAEHFSERMSLDPSHTAYLLDDDGAAFIVYRQGDDYIDMDSAGGRVACGVIEPVD